MYHLVRGESEDNSSLSFSKAVMASWGLLLLQLVLISVVRHHGKKCRSI